MRPIDAGTLTAEELRATLDYDLDSGFFRWKRANNQKKIGDIAGTARKSGYRFIVINGRHYAAHRLAWLYVHGRWPSELIDHENLDKSDNRICNLREATWTQNKANERLRSDNQLRCKGVSVSGKRFKARISFEKTALYIGLYDTLDAAKAAYESKAQELFGRFARGE